MKKIIAVAAATFFCAFAFNVHASGEHEDAVRSFGEVNIKPWLTDSVLVNAIKKQNQETAQYDETTILAMDKAWRTETSGSVRPTIEELLERPASVWLSKKKEQSGGVVTEIFVMDAKGLNVAQSDMTSDYWQGDEAKWAETFLVGPDAVHVSDVEHDESTQMFQSQLSLPVIDPETGKVIGAITVGVNLDALL